MVTLGGDAMWDGAGSADFSKTATMGRIVFGPATFGPLNRDKCGTPFPEFKPSIDAQRAPLPEIDPSIFNVPPLPVIDRPIFDVPPKVLCWCEKCRPNNALNGMRLITCVVCGNKRCPKARWHGYQCTGSNEPGQIPVLESPPHPGGEVRAPYEGLTPIMAKDLDEKLRSMIGRTSTLLTELMELRALITYKAPR